MRRDFRPWKAGRLVELQDELGAIEMTGLIPMGRGCYRMAGLGEDAGNLGGVILMCRAASFRKDLLKSQPVEVVRTGSAVAGIFVGNVTDMNNGCCNDAQHDTVMHNK